MGNYRIDLATRYQNAFGFLAKNFGSKILNVGISNSGIYKNFELYEGEEEEFENISMKAKGIILNFGSLPFTQGKSGLFKGKMAELFNKSEEKTGSFFAPPPMVSFNRSKAIKETYVNGSDAVVVENYGLKPWNIKLSGIIIDMESHHYPKKKVEELNNFFEINDRVEITGNLFSDKGIDSIYFKSISFDMVEGFPDTIKYSLQARSIKPIEFELN
ncbi:MAG: DUF6046 domain-containing protein [Marinifilaceae bacterium]|jgi:hypothetical protein|nr:DUF6046 domain-containing protein [Marinifilaceae bacterium]